MEIGGRAAMYDQTREHGPISTKQIHPIQNHQPNPNEVTPFSPSLDDSSCSITLVGKKLLKEHIFIQSLTLKNVFNNPMKELVWIV